jgi:DNA-binding protein YbaB
LYRQIETGKTEEVIMLDKLKNMFEAQKKMNDIKKGLESVIVDNEHVNGKIKVSMSGTQRIISIDIDDSLLNADKRLDLQKNLVSCINKTSEKVQKVAADQLKSVMGDMKIPGI